MGAQAHSGVAASCTTAAGSGSMRMSPTGPLMASVVVKWSLLSTNAHRIEKPEPERTNDARSSRLKHLTLVMLPLSTMVATTCRTPADRSSSARRSRRLSSSVVTTPPTLSRFL